jgi:hypothetical protein
MKPSVLTLNNPKSMEVSKLSDGFELIFRPEKAFATTAVKVFLGVWLLGWLGGEIAAIAALFSGKAQSSGIAFLLVWLTGWSIGGFVFINVFLAFCFGRRIVRVQSDSLEISDRYGMWNKRLYFPMSRVKNLRIDSENQETQDSEPYTLHCISADCSGKRTVLASSTEEEDLAPAYNQLTRCGYFGVPMMTGYISTPQTMPPAGGSFSPMAQQQHGQPSSTGKSSDDEIYYADVPEDLK